MEQLDDDIQQRILRSVLNQIENRGTKPEQQHEKDCPSRPTLASPKAKWDDAKEQHDYKLDLELEVRPIRARKLAQHRVGEMNRDVNDNDRDNQRANFFLCRVHNGSAG
jgi:hypothetical protein